MLLSVCYLVQEPFLYYLEAEYFFANQVGVVRCGHPSAFHVAAKETTSSTPIPIRSGHRPRTRVFVLRQQRQPAYNGLGLVPILCVVFSTIIRIIVSVALVFRFPFRRRVSLLLGGVPPTKRYVCPEIVMSVLQVWAGLAIRHALAGLSSSHERDSQATMCIDSTQYVLWYLVYDRSWVLFEGVYFLFGSLL